ncbi:FAD-binding oxidoreductase [Neisseria sp. ZJ106]|uniref:D-amino-acid oxidase n=1 Tax=Neisseria lisongii TaxID=2912188 RepID=A0ABY7RHK0_9NEIS|nr:FAD-dependent oxidoreductase [Neisseria lisongii]MCF7520849.1 FAD-binding oxidoreductase [Neisseria lisongii]WCL70782.1 FAD-dependent oxidoreductase [Neisseria lisongii]
MKKYDIAIIGGGLFGRMAAWRLAQSGWKTVLYEASSPLGENSAAYVAAAMLAPLAEAIDATPLAVSLGYQSLTLWQQYLAQIGQPVFHQQNGSLMVWHTQDEPLAERFRRHLLRAHDGETVWQEWTQHEIAAQEPQLAGRFRKGLYLPQEGQLDNRQTLAALLAAAQQAGAECRFGEAADPETAREQAQWVLDCRGFAAKETWNTRSQSRLRGIRGEVARVFAPEVSLNRPVRLLHPRYPLYICPKENHVFVIGATQLESEDGGAVSVRSSLELFSALYAVCPAFGEARVLETAVGLRPTLQHENPEIRCLPDTQTIEINGLFRHGFMIAPAVCETLLQGMNNLAAGKAFSDGMNKERQSMVTQI